MVKYENAIQPKISFSTLLRLQLLTGKPIRRGFDGVLNEILDDYEKLIKSAGCKVQPADVEDCTACDTVT